MLFDTDVMVWMLRGDARAAQVIASAPEPAISIVTYMELLRGARNRAEVRLLRSLLSEQNITVSPLTETIGHRAAVYMEEHGARSGMEVSDALIAATAVENGVPFCTANRRHYRAIADLDLVPFRTTTR
jgi:predicted nucleic acid-binding protein